VVRDKQQPKAKSADLASSLVDCPWKCVRKDSLFCRRGPFTVLCNGGVASTMQRTCVSGTIAWSAETATPSKNSAVSADRQLGPLVSLPPGQFS
jgi:hypothetical protein